MNSKVRVTADSAGKIVVASLNNPDWGYIRVEQDKVVIDEAGFARKRTLSALIYGNTAELHSFGWSAGMELEGTIVAKDSLVPFNKKDPEKDLKIAGKTEIVCTLKGQPIYRKTFYRQNSDAKDEVIQHDNSSEIKAAMAEETLESSEKTAEL